MSDRARGRSCATCDYWSGPSRGLGDCRRRSPEWDADAQRPQWPRTYRFDWCGDWRDVRPPHSANPRDADVVAAWPAAKQVCDLPADDDGDQ